ncbi:MAG TPA: hypothetical protein VNK43_04110 [Gemmatimonadales bacterium]|nr:hypothetical protein [Gemmatimonadales bacterium]
MTTSATRISRVVGVVRSVAGVAAVAALVTGCGSLLESDELPPNVSDPAIIETPEGALAAYQGLLGRFREALGGASDATGDAVFSFVAITGLLSDELQATDATSEGESAAVDRRTTIEGQSNSVVGSAYARLQKVRGQASQAVGLLTRYAPPEQRALVGHVYALQAYAEVFLAELFCSGIPLSTLDYDGDYTLAPGSTTEQVYHHALGLFGQALAVAADSVRFVHLARMGQARALLGLGRLAEAAAAAAQVPDGYRYAVAFHAAAELNARSFARQLMFSERPWELTVADREGLNGLDYRASDDPRTRATLLGTVGAVAIYHPDKYDLEGATPIVLASDVEARLIEAEAALRGAAGGDWLGILNRLRTDGTFTTQPNPTDPGATDTVWNAGTGGVPGLRPLDDPGDADARVDLLFRERAFWLFLTGHRQGDLRRLVRQYGRDPQALYPTGAYPASAGASYGTDVTLPIPPAERMANPRFTGCISRGA